MTGRSKLDLLVDKFFLGIRTKDDLINPLSRQRASRPAR
jgi:hypothetical protein